MKTVIYIIIVSLAVFFVACDEGEFPEVEFEDAIPNTMYSYLEENDTLFVDQDGNELDEPVLVYSSFLQIVKAGGLKNTLNAYNPDEDGYTLFLPDNEAVEAFLQESSDYASLDDLLNDQDYAKAFVMFHVVRKSFRADQFPFGAFNEKTLSDDYLTVSFIIEGDSSYYKVNNIAEVVKEDIEVSNGYIHRVKTALTPVTTTSYGWLAENEGFSIFKEAVDLTGTKELIDFSLKDDEDRLGVTLLLEHDSIFRKHKINSIDDLIQKVSPENADYTNPGNSLYGFVAYHFLEGARFIDYFVNQSSNFDTYSEIPLNINGLGLDIAINKGKQIFDTIVFESDTSYIDFIKFNYDESNVLTQSGAIHFIDRVMTQVPPSRSRKWMEFQQEPLFDEFRNQGAGSYLVEKKDSLQTIEWEGVDYMWYEDNSGGGWIGARSQNYIEIYGDFTIRYTTSRILGGKYKVQFRANNYNTYNAIVEVFIDGKKMGGLVDLTTGKNSSVPIQEVALGTIDFKSYESHVVEVRALIPGRLAWDYISFEPIN